jgi:hypothetical protein
VVNVQGQNIVLLVKIAPAVNIVMKVVGLVGFVNKIE